MGLIEDVYAKKKISTFVYGKEEAWRRNERACRKRKKLYIRRKKYARREKEIKENFQTLVRKKEEKEKRERKENERKDREEKEKREKVMIEKESTKNSFSGVELDINNILSSLENPCEDVLEEKSMFGAKLVIDINVSSTENTKECLIQKEEEETNKGESFMTPPTSIAEKESLKGDCNTLNSSFKLYNVHSSSQKYQKQYFVMLLPSLGNKQKGSCFFLSKLL